MGRRAASASGRTASGGSGVAGRPAATASASGVTYIKDSRDRNNVLVNVSTSKLDKAWSQDKGGYIGPGGAGAIDGRRERFSSFLKSTNNGESKPIIASTVHLSKSGSVTFSDGRHRFSVLRDKGKRRVVVSVSRHQAKKVLQRFG